LYEAGEILSVSYNTSAFPSEEQLVADLREALELYTALRIDGGWTAEDDLLSIADGDGLNITLTQAKTYKQHRSIERQPKHVEAVKKVLGMKCMGCDRSMSEVYGQVGNGLIHAHHLTPLSRMAEGAAIELDPRTELNLDS
jgi:5-methylcytosine-specific restriction enzyme A